MNEQIDLVVVTEEKSKTGGLSLAVIVSLILHSAFIIWFVTRPRQVAPVEVERPMLRYVELLKQNERSREFVEAPGAESAKKAPLTAPFSDKNRSASMPEPNGATPTNRPGDGRSRIFTPPSDPRPRAQEAQPQPQPQQAQQQQQQQRPQQGSATDRSLTAPQTADAARAAEASSETFRYREPAKASATGGFDWREIAKSVRPPIGGGDGIDIGNAGGGDRGFAEQGPLSFETQWYDWGPYAQSMVSRIRVNWYANMPQFIRTGIGGVVTIRFTIQRDGRLTDITILKTSGHPPYDFAARKAIELSSPLNPLPKDFPNPNERVTAMFYYNLQIP